MSHLSQDDDMLNVYKDTCIAYRLLICSAHCIITGEVTCSYIYDRFYRGYKRF